MTIDVIVPEAMRKAYDAFHYAPAVREAGLIFCSGVIGQGDGAESEFRDAWEKIGAILAEAGAGYADIVDTTIYMVDLAANAATMAQVKDAFVHAPYPASTWIGVSSFVRPGARAEIKVTARVKP
jgi:enamine deaminase RidA (YjgF/YER057c/UK114 family)